MKKSKLINYTTQDFVSEKELELKLFRWNNIKDKYLPKLKANGILRIVTTRFGIKKVLADTVIYLNMKMIKHIKSANQFFKRLKEMRKKIN